MSGSIVLRCGGYPEINVYEFSRWIRDTYFKMPEDVDESLFLDRFDVNVEVEIDEVYGRIVVKADVVDVFEFGGVSEDMKRELRELARGND